MTNEELVELIQRGDDGRLPQLWKQVRRFIAWRARHFYKKMKLTGKTHGCELEDLIQSGYLALVAAVRYFKPREGYKFLTYLNYTLLSAFHEAMGLRTSKRDWLDYAISLDQPVGEDGNTSLLEMLGDPHQSLLMYQNRLLKTYGLRNFVPYWMRRCSYSERSSGSC